MKFPNSHWTAAYPVVFGKAQQITQNDVKVTKEATDVISGCTVFNKYNLKY